MKKILLLLLVSFTSVVLFNACSKDDAENAENINQNGGNVYRYQIVTINVPNTELEQDEYEGTLGNQSIELVKTEAHKLAFAVPIEAVLGNTELLIPNLNNAKISYNILQPILELSVDETVNLFTNSVGAAFETIEQSAVQSAVAQNNYDQFLAYYAQATPSEKEEIALFYQTNKTLFDSVLKPLNYGLEGGRFAYDEQKVAKYILGIQTGVFSLAAGATLLTIKNPYAALASAVAIGAGIGLWTISWDGLKEMGFKTMEMIVASIPGTNNRNASNEITLQDNTSITMPFQIGTRRLLNSDRTNATPRIKEVFSNLDKFNIGVIAKVNSVIVWIKTRIPFLSSSLQTFDTATNSTNASVTNGNVDNTTMQKISFRINHPNLELVNASLSSTGQLNLKVKIIGTPSTIPVISTLNYVYSDDYSNFSGHFDIKVSGDFLEGSWLITAYSDNTGEALNDWKYEYNNPQCPNLWSYRYRRLPSSLAIFTNSYYTIPIIREMQGRTIDSNPCEVLYTYPISSEEDTFSGTYSAPQGNNIPATLANATQTVCYFEIIDNNNIIHHVSYESGGINYYYNTSLRRQ